MRILIFIGPTDTGFNSCSGSEQRYLMNLAEMFAFYGNQVDCIGSDSSGGRAPSWGNMPKSPNVEFLHLSQIDFSKKIYDLAIVSENFCHWRNNGIPIQTPCSAFDSVAHRVGHTLFGWAGTGLPCASDRTHNRHFVFQPLEEHAGSHPADVVIHYPIYNTLAPVDCSKRNSIVWPCRGVYHPDWPKDMPFHFAGLKALKCMKALADNHNVRSVFLDAKYFQTERAKRLGATDLFNSIQNKQAYDALILRDALNQELLTARVSIVLPGYFSSVHVAPAQGAVPLGFREDFGNVCHSNQWLLDRDSSDEEFYSAVERFFIDDIYYMERLQVSYNVLERFSWKSSYDSFLKFAKERYSKDD